MKECASRMTTPPASPVGRWLRSFLQRGKAAEPTSLSKRRRNKTSSAPERPQSTSPRRAGQPETVPASVLRGDSSASMGGIGIALEETAGMARICGISPFSAAALSGQLALHDRIVAVNGVSCEGLSAYQVVSLLRDGAGPLLHVRVRPALSNHASSEHVAWVLRVRADGLGPSDMPTLEQYADSGSVGAVVSEGDNEALWHVDYIKVGGAAWLAAEHASMQSTIHGEIARTLMEGDCITTVDGQSVRNTDAPAVLRGPWFTRVQLGVLRKGIPLVVDIVRSPVLEREHLRHAFAYLSSLRHAFTMQHGQQDSWRPTLHTDAFQHAHTFPNHGWREEDGAPNVSRVEVAFQHAHTSPDHGWSEEDGAPNVSRVEAVAKMIHADLDKMLSSFSSPFLRSSAGILEQDEQSSGHASCELALDRVRAVLGTADAFKHTSASCQDRLEMDLLEVDTMHKHACSQSRTVNWQPISLSSPAASRRETLLQDATSLGAPGVCVTSRVGKPDAMPPAAIKTYPLQHHGTDQRSCGNVHDDGMRGEKEQLYGLTVQARNELERINAEHDRWEHQQQDARQRVLNELREENEQLCGQVAQERIHAEYDGRKHEREGVRQRVLNEIREEKEQPHGQIAQARQELERINAEYDGRRHEQGGDKWMNDREARSIWPSVIQPFVAPSQSAGGKMRPEQAARSAQDAQKGNSFAAGKSDHVYELEIIAQREQAVRAALGLEKYESPERTPFAASRTAYVATRRNTVVQDEQSLKTVLEGAGRGLNNVGIASERNHYSETPRVLPCWKMKRFAGDV